MFLHVLDYGLLQLNIVLQRKEYVLCAIAGGSEHRQECVEVEGVRVQIHWQQAIEQVEHHLGGAFWRYRYNNNNRILSYLVFENISNSCISVH